MYLLGIDLGTTGCKSMIFDTDGQILGDHYIEYELLFTDDGIEQRAQDWWNHTKTAIKRSIEKSGIDGRQIISLSISSQGIAFVPVGHDGQPLMNAISWYDARAHAEAEQMRQDFDPMDVCRRTGRQIGSLVFTEVMWLKKNRPEIYRKTWKFLMAMDYLVFCLCGKTITDYSMASGTLCYDTIEREWIQAFFDRYDIDLDKFPDIGCLGEPVATVLPDVAADLGLSGQTLVSLGFQDQKGAAIGAGIDDGMITVSLGTASAISTLTHQHLMDPSMQLFCHGFDRERWILESCVSTAGAAVKWVRNTFFKDCSYAGLDQLAQASTPGSNGLFFYPLLNQKRKDVSGRLTGLSLATARGDIFRSVLEGVAYEIDGYIKAHQKLNPDVARTEAIRVFGGGASSPVWCQIIADVTGKTVIIPRTHETGCLGAAITAAMGAGLINSLHDSVRLIGASKAQYEPDPVNHQIYRKLLDQYGENDLRPCCE